MTLTIIEKLGERDSKGNYKVKCRCDTCGKEVIKSRTNINRGSKSCGCLRIFMDKEERALNRAIEHYKGGARSRNLEFNLTKEEFKIIVLSKCAFCGSPPSNMISIKGLNSIDYFYNGVDRVDNSLGYTFSNCLPACYKCNAAKGDLSLKDYLLWLKRTTSWFFGN